MENNLQIEQFPSRINPEISSAMPSQFPVEAVVEKSNRRVKGWQKLMAGAAALGASFAGAVAPASAAEDTRLSANSSICLSHPDLEPGDTAVLNVISTEGTGGGWTAAYASDESPVYLRPSYQQFSTGNFALNTTDPNSAFPKVGTDGQFCVDNAVSAAHLIVDLFGKIPADSGYTPISPKRLIDTRPSGVKMPANSSICLTPEGAHPGDTAVLNVISTNGAGGGYTSARDSDAVPVYARPEDQKFSTGNYGPNTTDPNSAFPKVGSDGQVCIDNAVSAAHLIVDQFGVFPAESGLEAITPARLIDTRQEGPARNVLANSSRCMTHPELRPGDTAIINVVTTNGAGGGWTASRSSDATPVYSRSPKDQFSTGNFGRDTADPNFAFPLVGPDGRFCVDSAISDSNLVVDLFGRFPANKGYVPITPTRLLDNRQGNTLPPGPQNAKIRVGCDRLAPGDGLQYKSVQIEFPEHVDVYNFDGSIIELGELADWGTITTTYEDGTVRTAFIDQANDPATGVWLTRQNLNQPQSFEHADGSSDKADPLNVIVSADYKNGADFVKVITNLVIPHCNTLNPGETQPFVEKIYNY